MTVTNPKGDADALNNKHLNDFQWGAEAYRVMLVDSSGSNNSTSTSGLIFIDSVHNEIHEGDHYYIEGYTTLASGDELRVKLVTPDSTTWSHFVWEITSTAILTTEFYEGASGGMTGGSSVTPFNNNRNSSNTSTMTITSGVSTATDDGTLISEAKWGANGGWSFGALGGSMARNDELILKQNTTYLRKFISGSNDNIVFFKASWYEMVGVD